MRKCKIGIIETDIHKDLAVRISRDMKVWENVPMHKEGDVFLGDYAKPEGLCDEAWKAMYQYVFALAHGSEKFYYGDWIDKEE